MVYLDANATEPLRPQARIAVAAALDVAGNPSSVHARGRQARRILEDAREVIAGRFGCRPEDCVFTSGGTEADTMAVHVLGSGRRIIVGSTEHDAIRAVAPEALVLPVDRAGLADLATLERMLAEAGPALVCLMLANNETGVIHPVREAADVCRRHGAVLHVDAVQAAGRIPVRLDHLGSASLAISSHKLGGPAGAGALLLAPQFSSIPALIPGGGQERGRRGGTQPVAVIAGFAAAARACAGADALMPMRDAIETAARDCGALVGGAAAPRLPNTTCLALPGVRAQVQVIALDLEGIAVSAGAACSSGKISASRVLTAMGLGPSAGEAIRVSLPWNAAWADVEAFVTAYRCMADRLRAKRSFPLAQTVA